MITAGLKRVGESPSSRFLQEAPRFFQEMLNSEAE
tara:strand:+ start:229 stop:333 length:105 start_codon:yes stop_codon:yes gene_type:complete